MLMFVVLTFPSPVLVSTHSSLLESASSPPGGPLPGGKPGGGMLKTGGGSPGGGTPGGGIDIDVPGGPPGIPPGGVGGGPRWKGKNN